MVLITAHTELEHVTLERELGRFKRQTDQRWGELVYDGLWYSPLKRALESFVADTQEHVSGEIRMVLHGGHIAVNGRRSAESLYDFNLATYDEGDTFDQSVGQGLRARARPVVEDRRAKGPRASEHQRGLAVGRSVRRRPVGRACRAEQVDPLRLGAGAVRRRRVEGARPGAVPGRAADRGAARRPAGRSGQPRRGRRRRQLRAAASPTRTCTARWNAG